MRKSLDFSEKCVTYTYLYLLLLPPVFVARKAKSALTDRNARWLRNTPKDTAPPPIISPVTIISIVAIAAEMMATATPPLGMSLVSANAEAAPAISIAVSENAPVSEVGSAVREAMMANISAHTATEPTVTPTPMRSKMGKGSSCLEYLVIKTPPKPQKTSGE